MGTTLSRTLRDAISALADVGEIVLRERPTMEHVLLVIFFVTGAYMFWGAREFSAGAAIFPRLTAGATVVLSALLLARNYLPEPIRSVVSSPTQMVSTGDVEEDVAASDDEQADSDRESAGTYTYDIDDPRGPAVVGVLSVVYMVLTFTIGMLYATPIFVALYALWADISWPKATALVASSFGIAYVFFLLVTPEVAVGWYTEWRFPVPVLPELPFVAVSALTGGSA
ncbi:tripartite tricarboxylate transporter TctB family protein [Natronolimnohabitans sp. A-GB9]|uniref:tripartite tricarboxylate transporter TctB family protein n=1 Tax=Natronolimnohabitans sp. A-GB9 TaxID=3069757 RepID=UPI0027B6D99A|nr:tripartite tricarboxylate transporter TctB family protein [Natronolimnohabitans sp. A-GB9]MDQ2049579.1 tripartite tricarboxylate transporter TctB family protein [Natronolimnohabitans sp. A-GB9]